MSSMNGHVILIFLGCAIFLYLLSLVGTAIYNVYFHPLSKYPGPKLCAASELAYQLRFPSGTMEFWILKMHQQYGDIVRLGPNRLSFINPRAWKDIYAHRTATSKSNSKDSNFYMPEFNGVDHIISTIDDTKHGQVRKIFSHAFSDRALKLQESLIKTHVSRLIGNIRRAVSEKPNAPIDLVSLYNCTTFDIMGDLTFGEPLGLLENSEMSPWVKAVFGCAKYANLLRIGKQYPAIGYLVWLLMPHDLRSKMSIHFVNSVDRVNRRLEKGNDKPDIWNLVLEKSKLSTDEMHSNASIFMLAGTETTATLLSGLTYYLLKNPDKLKKATEEIRLLPSEADLNLTTLPQQKYLAACFEEALRTYPPVPSGLPRVVPPGGNVICGEVIPEKTSVSVPIWAAFHSSRNFTNPESFAPERWLSDPEFDQDQKEALQPFSYGPRNCLGKNLAYHEMRLIMAMILWNFDLKLCSQSENWANQRSFIFWEKPPLWVKTELVRRSEKDVEVKA